MSIIALMTDFGMQDYYVGAMKGMILQINPKATLVDVSHDIESQNLYHGAFVLRQVWPCFPAGSIFVVVIDPGVGSRRRILAARYNDRLVLVPDNGVITLVHRDADLQEMCVVENRRYFASTISATFHGRDIFAPVAGHLSRGLPLKELGPPAERVEVLDLARPRLNRDGSIDGEIVLVDRFGNLVSNISEMDILAARPPRPLEAYVGSTPVGSIRGTYADVRPGELVAVIGSSQMLEIAVNRGNASVRLNAARGQPVRLQLAG